MSEEARNPIIWTTLLVIACTVNVVLGQVFGHDGLAWLAGVLGGVAVALVVGVPLDRRLSRGA
jgi:hypothetical protein